MSEDRVKITSEMKATCIGEFKLIYQMHCPECDEDEPDPDCGICLGMFEYEQGLVIPWTEMKDIYEMMFNCSPQKERIEQLQAAIKQRKDDCYDAPGGISHADKRLFSVLEKN